MIYLEVLRARRIPRRGCKLSVNLKFAPFSSVYNSFWAGVCVSVSLVGSVCSLEGTEVESLYTVCVCVCVL